MSCLILGYVLGLALIGGYVAMLVRRLLTLEAEVGERRDPSR